MLIKLIPSLLTSTERESVARPVKDLNTPNDKVNPDEEYPRVLIPEMIRFFSPAVRNTFPFPLAPG